jgi:uncharacterized surface protein with fasciclin (FAS1) repeats
LDVRFGGSCGPVPTSGPGSVAGLASTPVAAAATAIPQLSTLAAAVQRAGLTDTLDQQRAITVFAPSNEAFGRIPKDRLNALLADKSQLTRILAYHVVPVRLSPEQLIGQQTSIQGGLLTISGGGESLTVDGARVICGNLQTANATVYIIDTVLTPIG